MFIILLQAKGLEDILQTALVQNKADFVDLLMDHIHMGNFVTKKRVLDLYNNVPSNHLLYRVLKATKYKVCCMPRLIRLIPNLYYIDRGVTVNMRQYITVEIFESDFIL